VRESGASLLSKFPAAPQFPSSLDAVKDFDDAVVHVIEHIGLEYSRFATESEKSADTKQNASGGMTAKAATSVPARSSGVQIESQAERRRERFLTEFTQSHKFKELRNRLKQAIFRIAVEKYKKEVSANH
jgi:hypothetical protein